MRVHTLHKTRVDILHKTRMDILRNAKVHTLCETRMDMLHKTRMDTLHQARRHTLHKTRVDNLPKTRIGSLLRIRTGSHIAVQSCSVLVDELCRYSATVYHEDNIIVSTLSRTSSCWLWFTIFPWILPAVLLISMCAMMWVQFKGEKGGLNKYLPYSYAHYALARTNIWSWYYINLNQLHCIIKQS